MSQTLLTTGFGPGYPKINTLWKRDAKNRILVGPLWKTQTETRQILA